MSARLGDVLLAAFNFCNFPYNTVEIKIEGFVSCQC